MTTVKVRSVQTNFATIVSIEFNSSKLAALHLQIASYLVQAHRQQLLFRLRPFEPRVQALRLEHEFWIEDVV